MKPGLGWSRSSDGVRYAKCIALALGAVLGCFVACAPDDEWKREGGERLSAREQRLHTDADAADGWDMEDASEWTIVTGSANRETSSVHNEGEFSLQLTAPAFVAVQSVPVSKPDAISPLLSVDVMVPNAAGPDYYGAIQMYVSVPSLNIYNAWVDQRELGEPTGVWQTHQFELPAEVYAQMDASDFDDLTVTLGLNPQAGLNAPYRLDNLRFVPLANCVGVPDGTLCDDGLDCTTGNLCDQGVCGVEISLLPGEICDPGDDVLGFENFPAWQLQNGRATLAPSSIRVQGERSLSITTPYFMTVETIPLSTLHKVSDTLSLSVRKPTSQPNPWWHGDVTLEMSVPSLGIEFSATEPLLGQPSGSFFELRFQLSAQTYELLATQSYDDLTFAISVNPPNGQDGFYLLDDLHFVPVEDCEGELDNTACDDLSLCTRGDSCDDGVCGAPVTCDDGNLCTTDSCNPALGCVFVNNALPCSDGNACTTLDTCSGGACVGGPPLACNDGNVCTDDACNPATGCVFSNNTAPCSDGNACTSADTCSGGACLGGSAVFCNDGNSCTNDACNPATGCTFTNNALPCNDGNACTAGDTCGGGACQPGAPVSCDDGTSCTQDSCNPAVGCSNTWLCGAGVCFNDACCQPRTCLDARAECGVVGNGCGGALNCGTCPTGGTCNPAGRCLPPNDFDQPAGINVCRILLEQLIIPPTIDTVLRCDDDACGFFTPDCCIPGVCLLNPLCTFLSEIVITPEEIFNAGDVYCSADLSPREYLELFVQRRLNDTATLGTFLTTGGLSALIDFDLQVMTAAGRHAPSHVQDLVRELTAPIYDGGATGFSYDDMEDIVLVSSSFPTAGTYLTADALAITLGPVVVLRDWLYDALFAGGNAVWTYDDFLVNAGTDIPYIFAVDTFIHELVHVKQYRELGRNNFYVQYLGEAAVQGASASSFEREAYAYEIGLTELQGGVWCARLRDQQNGQIALFNVPVPLNTCPDP